MSRVCAIGVALVLCCAAGARADDAAPAPSSDPPAATQPAAMLQADELLRQLSADNWRQRNSTVHRVVALGSEAEPVLRELLRHELAPETRKNLELAAEQIRQNRMLGPSLITMHVKDATPAEVFASIARQCTGVLPTWPDKLWTEANWPRLTLDYERQPFWNVMADLGKRLELDYLSTEPQDIRLARDSGHTPGGTCIQGAFLMTADAVTFRNGMNVELSVYAEPKIVVTRAISFKLDLAEDDHGRPLLPQTSRRFFGRRFRTGSRQLPMPFQRPVEEVSRIGRFQGRVTIAIQASAETWEVRDPLTISPVTRLVDSMPVTLETFAPVRSGEAYELLATIPAGWSSRGTQDEMTELIRKRMQVFDAAGHSLALGTVDTRSTNEGTEITADFSAAPQPDGGKTGPPARLVWQIPAETRTLVLPFDFKDLPITDPFN